MTIARVRLKTVPEFPDDLASCKHLLGLSSVKLHKLEYHETVVDRIGTQNPRKTHKAISFYILIFQLLCGSMTALRMVAVREGWVEPKHFITAVSALLFAAVANAQQPTWSSCATASTTDMTVSAFSVDPYPLCINEDVCATVTGTLLTDVIAPAKLDISGKFLGSVVYTDNQDLCAILEDAGHPCPLPKSTPSITACVLVKPSVPAIANVQLTIQATNGNNRILFCQDATFTTSTCA
ncbi:hypothetical protein BGZ59_008522 [Podila verticillata]|nr:hypothetical protein BGZ59_008522 [Podila verticillata]